MKPLRATTIRQRKEVVTDSLVRYFPSLQREVKCCIYTKMHCRIHEYQTMKPTFEAGGQKEKLQKMIHPISKPISERTLCGREIVNLVTKIRVTKRRN